LNLSNHANMIVFFLHQDWLTCLSTFAEC